MKSRLRAILSITLCAIMIFGSVAIGGGGFAEVLDAFMLKADAYSTGDYIYYGTYPQTDVTDSLGAVLNNQPGTWVSYNYYSGDIIYSSMKPSNYMRYKDVSYNGNKYRSVTFDTYRPYRTENTTSTSCLTYQDDNGYYYGNVYWFKYEPIKWRILDPSTGLIMCDTILDSQAYNNYILSSGTDEYGNTAHWGNAAKTYYANNYAKSSIREWLNKDFYNTAFSSSQQSNILYTTFDNSAYSTSYSAYDSESTTDKVFLLSYDEVMNSKYGFTTSSGNDSARQLKGSDYAKSQGLYVLKSSGLSYDGCSDWHLCSPGYSPSDACGVSDGGYVYSLFYTSYTSRGVVPALRLQNLKSDYAGSDDDGLNPYIEGFVSDLTVDYKSSVILHANFDNIKGENITWYVNGNVFAHGDSIMLNSLTKDSAVYCEGVDSNGKVYKSDVENIHVRTSFWIRLKAFFRSLFGLLPIIDQK